MAIDIEIVQLYYENINPKTGEFVKTAPKDPIKLSETKIARDSSLHLKLTVNMRIEEVEDVEICDKFIVNRPFNIKLLSKVRGSCINLARIFLNKMPFLYSNLPLKISISFFLRVFSVRLRSRPTHPRTLPGLRAGSA